ncbi:preprotein translocase subunit Sec61beta [Candidatus Pacearchaeota archaeon]|nr:preprotein translocase subunit Sec61beta [Candidatus Pacearchaeota archaeon]
MAKDGSISMPGVFGGLMRYNEEYDSRLKITPLQVIVFVVVLALGVVILKLFLPI